MAINRFSVKPFRRSRGESAPAKAAYRAGERIVDERTGNIYDYRAKRGVDHTEILVPPNCKWAQNISRADLWNKVELTENRHNSQVGREAVISLPKELSPDQNIALVREFALEHFVSEGMIADLCFHMLNSHNPHVHASLTMRKPTKDGFGKKMREWNDKRLLRHWRSQWAKAANRALESAGYSERIDHRSLIAQEIERVPVSRNRAAMELEKRDQKQSLVEETRTVYANLEKQYGHNFRLGKADWFVARTLSRRGYSAEDIKASIKKVRTNANPAYLDRTVERAFSVRTQDNLRTRTPHQKQSPGDSQGFIESLLNEIRNLDKANKERGFMLKIRLLYATGRISKKTYETVLETNQKWLVGQERHKRFKAYAVWLHLTGRMSAKTLNKVLFARKTPKTKVGAYALYLLYQSSKRQLKMDLIEIERTKKGLEPLREPPKSIATRTFEKVKSIRDNQKEEEQKRQHQR